MIALLTLEHLSDQINKTQILSLVLFGWLAVLTVYTWSKNKS